MNTQFATQFLLEDTSTDWFGDLMKQYGADETFITFAKEMVEQGLITPEKAVEIFKQTVGLDEMSTTGGGTTAGAAFTPGAGEQMATTKAFKGTRKKKYQEDAPRLAGSPAKTTKQGAKNLSAYSSVGFTKAPNAEEAGKKIKGVQVKQLWKEGDEEVAVSWSMIEDEVKMLGQRDLGIEPNTPDENRFLDFMKGAFQQGLIRSYNDLLHTVGSYRETLKESRRYSQFKKEAAIRSKPQQMHEAVKMVNKKLEEISKLLEFTNQMRFELSEGEELLEYQTNTKRLFEKVHSRVVEIYSKTKKLK